MSASREGTERRWVANWIKETLVPICQKGKDPYQSDAARFAQQDARKRAKGQVEQANG